MVQEMDGFVRSPNRACDPRVAARSAAEAGHRRRSVKPMRGLSAIALAAIAANLDLAHRSVGTAEDLLQSLSVHPRHGWLIWRWLLALARAKVVTLSGDRYHVTGHLPHAAPDRLEEYCASAQIPAEMASFYRSALTHLPELLRDELSVHSLLFEKANMSTMLAAEQLNVFTRHVDDVCAQFVSRMAARREYLRVVELGGGGGRTTRAVLGELPALPVGYRFTDGAAMFLSAPGRADERVSADLLDFDEDFGAQGFPAGSADVVIAGHSLHHAVDITATVKQIRQLLAPGGELLLSVLTRDEDMALATTQFLYSPEPGGQPLRAGEIFPGASVWRSALHDSGFDVVSTIGVGDCASSGEGYRFFHAVPDRR